ncbi:Squalene/phytoene synthase-domain-containing protein [Blyttiomyces helicus]|uniref:Bifunctional lycopene cyclase/phytoene synthase n=1 Tax=Blyttiomyces helicus TaxID=388810 RepID=A0A4P9WHY2_9FUNG|nr:Squalene/phytoene synthase-domain-containing protein [Blyttiomyces helicus]|eukprot:RKO92451.1 Squalene/phytoene synthase-domain-containing protein [Blyttiomyces helicus]
MSPPISPQCLLSYAQVHLLFTIPTTAVLFLVTRPLLTKVDRAKLILLPLIAFVWTTPWDNEIVRNGGTYRKDCILYTIGYVPIEEYFFFLIQSFMTTLSTILITRWTLPPLHLFPYHSRRSPSPHIPLPTLITFLFALAGLRLATPSHHTYYLGMILWWASIPLMLLTWGTSGYIARMGSVRGVGVWCVAVGVPTAYLWGVDGFAIGMGTWHISEATSLNTFPLPNLPLEEAIFFLATNSILVTACMAFDRCVAISRTLDIPSPTPISPSHLPVQWSSVATMWRAFIVPDQMGFEGGDDESPQARLAHVAKALAVLSRASRSFAAASLLLPWDLRMDLGILYAFCRVGDDLVDEDGDEASQGVRIERLELLRRTVDAVYADPLRPAFSRRAVRALFGSKQDSKPAAQPTSTGQLTPEQQTELCAVASALTDLAQIVPRRCWDELLSGYALDIGAKGGGGGPRMDTVADLIDYGERVAGSVGEMCTRVVLARCGCPPSDAAAAAVVSSARRMGVALQLVNVARDAVQDARDLGRCYLPRELFHDSDAWIVDALVAGRVAAGPDCASGWVRPVAIRDTVLALTDLAEQIHAEAIVGIAALKSAPARAGLRAACAVYGGIGDAVKDMDDEEVARGARARLGVGRMVWIALRAIYGAW